MAKEENPTSAIIGLKGVPIIQTLNMVSQKVIQVDKPTGYYKNKNKNKDIYLLSLFLLDN